MGHVESVNAEVVGEGGEESLDTSLHSYLDHAWFHYRCVGD